MIGQDGATHYFAYLRDTWGRSTNVLESYSTCYNEGMQTRTNKFVYAANGIDLASIIGPDGETAASYTYDAHHNVLTMTDATNEVTTYTYDSQGRLTSSKTPAGLTTTNIYYATGQYTNWIQSTIGLEIQRTNSYVYANDLIVSNTDERGLTLVNTYDDLQRVRRVDYPDGTFVTNTYDKLDLVRTLDRMGFTNSYAYDSAFDEW